MAHVPGNSRVAGYHEHLKDDVDQMNTILVQYSECGEFRDSTRLIVKVVTQLDNKATFIQRLVYEVFTPPLLGLAESQ